ncbi:MAG: hypothetical protein LBS50_11225 [Prevotellaceae bacterium]|jgi:hypothetical protein|nr:hypothetical protein [Prevotellaceae bacterium]
MITELYAAYNAGILSIPNNAEFLTVRINVETENYLVEREVVGGFARFDVAAFARKYFVKKVLVIDDRIFEDTLFALNLSVQNVAGTETFFSTKLINAVAQVGESPNLISKKGVLRTNFERLKKYEGYELTVGCLLYNGTTYINSIPKTSSREHVLINVFDTDTEIVISTVNQLTNNLGEILTNNFGEILEINGTDFNVKRLPVLHLCTPENPFYIRWVNQLGGYDYWMFGRRQSYEYKLSGQEEFKPYFDDVETAHGTTKIFTMNAKESATVGAEQVTNVEYDVISKVVLSPLIEWYNGELGKWLEIQVNDFEMAKNTGSSAQNIEITFDLPDKQIQF